MLGLSVVCLGLIILAVVVSGGPARRVAVGYRVSVLFAETGQLQPNAEVRIAGVSVGTVVSVKVDGTKSVVMIQLLPQFAPIPADTQAILREKTLLTEAYVDLSTGSTDGPKLRDGGQIRASQVSTGHQLDQILKATG